MALSTLLSRKIPRSHICLVVLCLVGVLFFLLRQCGRPRSEYSLVHKVTERPVHKVTLRPVHKVTERPVHKVTERAVHKVTERPTSKSKQNLVDSLVEELQESLNQIALVGNVTKVKESDVMKCYFTDEELKRNKCPPGVRMGCIQESMSKDMRHRLEDLLYNEYLQIAPEYRKVLHDLENQVEGYHDLVIISALSSNHYRESQAMLKEIHQKIFPIIPKVKIIIYDIGLPSAQRKEYEKYCQCQIIRFPFEKFPQHCRELKCFCWKTIVTRAHLASGDTVMWMDASVRYTKPHLFLQALKRTQTFGVQQNRRLQQPKLPIRALPQMFHHFGFTPCTFKDFYNAASNWAMYRNSPLIQHAVLDTWVACGLNRSCTCPGSIKKYLFCPDVTDTNRHYVAHCQRPQTVIALILARLWMEDYYAVAALQDSFELWKDHQYDYFKELKAKQHKAFQTVISPSSKG